MGARGRADGSDGTPGRKKRRQKQGSPPQVGDEIATELDSYTLLEPIGEDTEGTGDFSFARVERGFRANAGVRVKSEVVMSVRQPPSSTGCRSSDTQQRWFAAALLSLVATCSAACTCRSQRGIQTCLTRLAFLKNANALETARHQTKAIT